MPRIIINRHIFISDLYALEHSWHLDLFDVNAHSDAGYKHVLVCVSTGDRNPVLG